jgi:hypothetical protein
MTKIVRGVYVEDVIPRRMVRDDVLSAITPGKVLALGTVWTGELRPVLDMTVAAFDSIISGFTSGRVLHAKNSSASLDLGRCWLGELRSKIADAATGYARQPSGSADSTVELSPILKGVGNLQEVIENGGDPKMVRDAVASLKRARAAIDGPTSAPTRDAIGDYLRTSGEQSRAKVLAINSANASFWRDRIPTAPTMTNDRRSSSQVTEVRDHIHAAHNATDTRDKVEALNAANRAFWASR